MTERYSKYQKRYRAYMIDHMLRVSFHILLCLLAFTLCIAWFPVMIMRYGLSGIKLISLLVLILFLFAFAVIGICSIKGHCEEIAQLRTGKVIVETGIIVQKSKFNKYLIEISVSDGRRGQKLSRRERKESSDRSAADDGREKRHTVPKDFFIPPKNSEHDFHIGEQVTVVYAATKLLQIGCYPGWRAAGITPRYAIYAFEGDETENILPVRWEKGA